MVFAVMDPSLADTTNGAPDPAPGHRFDAAERDAARARLLDLARADPDVVAPAVTGSAAAGAEDQWSDVDLGFAVARGRELGPVIERLTSAIEERLGVVHYWDLPAGDATFRVFLLPSGLEVDLAFTPERSFGARGPHFRIVFGEQSGDVRPAAEPDLRSLIGLGWHHVLHARACLARDRPWQAEWLISGARDHVLSLACARERLPTAFARGYDRLAAGTQARFEEALPRSLEPAELERALAVMVQLLLEEVRAVDGELAPRLELALRQVV
jgi:hypothetical protein